jgi:hypothetical protein
MITLGQSGMTGSKESASFARSCKTVTLYFLADVQAPARPIVRPPKGNSRYPLSALVSRLFRTTSRIDLDGEFAGQFGDQYPAPWRGKQRLSHLSLPLIEGGYTFPAGLKAAIRVGIGLRIRRWQPR